MKGVGNVIGKSNGMTAARGSVLRQALTMGDCIHVAENLDVFRSCCDWIANYLARPHAELGRTGNVCPFAAPAITKDTLRIAVVRLTDETAKKGQIVEAITSYRDTFLHLESSDENQILQAILILFPDVQAHEAADLIDTTKEELKAEFVEQGLMLGEFHSTNQSPALRNPAFKPLRSPIPMLVIRRMVSTDHVFLNRSEYDPATRLQYLETYLRTSGLADSNVRKELERIAASLRAHLFREDPLAKVTRGVKGSRFRRAAWRRAGSSL
jgi:hypothetical protein